MIFLCNSQGITSALPAPQFCWLPGRGGWWVTGIWHSDFRLLLLLGVVWAAEMSDLGVAIPLCGRVLGCKAAPVPYRGKALYPLSVTESINALLFGWHRSK